MTEHYKETILKNLHNMTPLIIGWVILASFILYKMYVQAKYQWQKRKATSPQLIKLINLPDGRRERDRGYVNDNSIKRLALSIYKAYSPDVHEKAAPLLSTEHAINLVEKAVIIMQQPELITVFRSIELENNTDTSNPVVAFYRGLQTLLLDYNESCLNIKENLDNAAYKQKENEIKTLINQ